MKICDGKIIELDPAKWYWLVVREDAVSQETLRNLRKEDGQIFLVDDINGIEFVENPDRIKGVIVKKFEG